MKKTIIFLIALFLLLFVIIPQQVFAEQKASGSSAVLTKNHLIKTKDPRVEKLRAYLTKWNSPLTDSAETFVKEADKNDLDWKFVAAIAGLESGFGKAIPYNSYNAWGWGVYGDNVIRFNSWDEGISTISKGLRENYINKWGAKNVYEIGRIYAASPTWAQRVSGFMDQIDAYEPEPQLDSIALSI